ncbi:hypothetical protein SODALDRAFT_334834 [Sodiomyces alkalinus F11]|uniref:Heterokaryon incompatibility domain-containing protein n=1 Tax=Sodiomyces alkalinus (strain CBS 110278 / VKM F-3762 / F11) TaxID=1314773 RepID=A0A3N2PTE9_SODAK|nr:hypothetical protein SODALDRAFT_334834 [Sodiomyces alkalinus F11]ROT37704.1 hypothetical protein SODALDRAFT_334834 [Sodiomyces alkalinus F11]
MASLPRRLLGRSKGNYFVFDPRAQGVTDYDILSYRWGDTRTPYRCDIGGVDWDVILPEQKLKDIKRLMESAGIDSLWVDCVCIHQTDRAEMAAEMANMYHYYKRARRCHILIDMDEVWDPDEIGKDLRFIDHILTHMGGAALAAEATRLTENMTRRLSEWAHRTWLFPLDESVARAAGVEMGLLNCYSTCIRHVCSLFQNLYFSRVWTFQEMLLGKNITLWGVNKKTMSCIGHLYTWMDLATDAKDKAYKLQAWIESCRVLKSASVKAVLARIEDDNLTLGLLQIQVKGINSARTDIISGGPHWWLDNHKGISNVFSAVSLRPRGCVQVADIFRGLLGVFNGLFTAEEIEREMPDNDIESSSFSFFKQLSEKTGYAWTRLAISSKDRGEWDWIPVMASSSRLLTTDCFAGVVQLGRLKPNGVAKTDATTGLIGKPRKYMTIRLRQENSADFNFSYHGCNCGRSIKTGFRKTEQINLHDRRRNVVGDETGRTLVILSTLLGSIMEPGGNVKEYRYKLLSKLLPNWRVTDPNAKPTDWIDRCVSGTPWENPNSDFIRVHNESMNYRLADMISCASRLANDTTKCISCEIVVNCGCTIIGPFALMMQAIVSMEGSFLGATAANLDADDRIVLQDGLGLVQIGDVGREGFHLVAFEGDVQAYRLHAAACRNTKDTKPVFYKGQWPTGRAMVREDFKHGFAGMTRDYGYVDTDGSGNLLICRNHPIDPYRIVGVCIDEHFHSKKGKQPVYIK